MPSPPAIASILANATSENCAGLSNPAQPLHLGVSRTPNKMKKYQPVKCSTKFNTDSSRIRKIPCRVLQYSSRKYHHQICRPSV